MLDRLKSFFGALTEREPENRQAADDTRVAAAALMFHVMDADGVRLDEERARLREMLAEAYGIAGDELEALIAAGEAASRDAVDLFSFTSVLNRGLDEKAKVEFIGILWEMVYADGELHELEDNIVWRVAELIGVSPRDRVEERRRVREGRGAGASAWDD